MTITVFSAVPKSKYNQNSTFLIIKKPKLIRFDSQGCLVKHDAVFAEMKKELSKKEADRIQQQKEECKSLKQQLQKLEQELQKRELAQEEATSAWNVSDRQRVSNVGGSNCPRDEVAEWERGSKEAAKGIKILEILRLYWTRYLNKNLIFQN
jgi:hypothetical protein